MKKRLVINLTKEQIKELTKQGVDMNKYGHAVLDTRQFEIMLTNK